MQGPGPGLTGLHTGSRPVVTDWPVRSLKAMLNLKKTQREQALEAGAPSSVPSLAGNVSVAVMVPVSEVNVFVSSTSLGACSNPSPHEKAADPEFGKVERST